MIKHMNTVLQLNRLGKGKYLQPEWMLPLAAQYTAIHVYNLKCDEGRAS